MRKISLMAGMPAAFFMVLSLLFLTALPAHAQQFVAAPGFTSGSNSAWTVYAFGNAQAVADSFRAIANFINSGTFRGLVALLAVVGVLMVGVSSGFSSLIARKFISYAVFVFLVVYLLFGFPSGQPISVKVEVIDTVDGTWKAPVTVPAVVGIPAALISSAGHFMTVQAEASFPLPDQMKMSRGAPFNLAATLLSDMSKAKIQDPNITNSLAYYVQDCFTLGAAQGLLSASVLLDSTDFINAIHVDMPGVYVNTTLSEPVGVPDLKNCPEAHKLIKEKLNAVGGDASSFMTNASSWHGTPALNVVNSAASSVASWLTNGVVSGGGGELVKQAAVLSAFQPAFAQAATQTGNSDFLTTLAVTQAKESQKNSWIVGAEIFNSMMGYFFAVLQVFIYALTPLILAAALIPSLGMSLLKNFVQVLIWLALWQPMLAIVNFVIVSMQRAKLGGALGSGFTMNNLSIISENTSNLTAAATLVGTMVPVLAWAFVKGSVDFSRMIGSAVGENFAQSAGNTVTTGNYSLNSGSMDSFTSNKTSISPVSDFGNKFTQQGVERFKSQITDNAGGLELNGVPISVSRSHVQGTQVGGAATDAAQETQTGGSTKNVNELTNLAELKSQVRAAGSLSQFLYQTGLGAHAGGSISSGGRNPNDKRGMQLGDSSEAGDNTVAPGSTHDTPKLSTVKKLFNLLNPGLQADARADFGLNQSEIDTSGTNTSDGTNLTDSEALAFQKMLTDQASTVKGASTQSAFNSGVSTMMHGPVDSAMRDFTNQVSWSSYRQNQGVGAFGPKNPLSNSEHPIQRFMTPGVIESDYSARVAEVNDEKGRITTLKDTYRGNVQPSPDFNARVVNLEEQVAEHQAAQGVAARKEAYVRAGEIVNEKYDKHGKPIVNAGRDALGLDSSDTPAQEATPKPEPVRPLTGARAAFNIPRYEAPVAPSEVADAGTGRIVPAPPPKTPSPTEPVTGTEKSASDAQSAVDDLLRSYPELAPRQGFAVQTAQPEPEPSQTPTPGVQVYPIQDGGTIPGMPLAPLQQPLSSFNGGSDSAVGDRNQANATAVQLSAVQRKNDELTRGFGTAAGIFEGIPQNQVPQKFRSEFAQLGSILEEHRSG